MTTPVKTCACGRELTLAEWLALPHGGIWRIDTLETLELRNCPCGSTISLPVDEVTPCE